MTNQTNGSESDDQSGYHNWDHDLDSLQETGRELIEEWREENPHSPRDYPTVQWLRNNGYSHLRWVLREKHDMGTPEFFILLVSVGGEQEYKWNINNVATKAQINAYLDDRVECRDWATSTKRTNRARINEYLRRFVDEYGDDRILMLANDPSKESEVYYSFKQVTKELREDFITDESVHKYVRATHRFFEALDRSSRIEYDPMEGIEKEFNWDWGSEPTLFEDEQVRRLWITAETDEERILVIGYCAWGLRTKELPSLHIDQFNFDVQDPYIEFEDEQRKNGQGEVSLLFGLDSLARLLDKRDQQSNWNGYLYPSPEETRSYLCAKQARKRFKSLCKKAGVSIEGEVATPKHGRSFYYNILCEADTDLLERAGEFAKEQGSQDAKAVRNFYLTDEQQRKYRRAYFRGKIRSILPEDAHTEYGDDGDYDSTFEDFA